MWQRARLYPFYNFLIVEYISTVAQTIAPGIVATTTELHEQWIKTHCCSIQWYVSCTVQRANVAMYCCKHTNNCQMESWQLICIGGKLVMKQRSKILANDLHWIVTTDEKFEVGHIETEIRMKTYDEQFLNCAVVYSTHVTLANASWSDFKTGTIQISFIYVYILIVTSTGTIIKQLC